MTLENRPDSLVGGENNLEDYLCDICKLDKWPHLDYWNEF